MIEIGVHQEGDEIPGGVGLAGMRLDVGTDPDYIVVHVGDYEITNSEYLGRGGGRSCGHASYHQLFSRCGVCSHRPSL